MATVTASDLRRCLSDVLGRVQYGGEHVAVTQHGRIVAVLVSAEDFELLRAIEDRVDLEAALKATREAEEHGYVDWTGLKSELTP
ncbi:MAG TPA: type II toxin-antitoxin system Phd/YefM family antitoxin [Thermomicrobiales bacterium]|nr:type II toxin-antitoxin system Phd/YefM family antitoxin [Thermomicrobiales bacterium]